MNIIKLPKAGLSVILKSPHQSMYFYCWTEFYLGVTNTSSIFSPYIFLSL